MVAIHRAALKADAGNYRAANELGVILANNGQLGSAREQFLTSAEICKRPENLRNLGVVLKKMGANGESEKILQLASHQPKNEFAQSSGVTGDENAPLVYQVNQQEFAARSNEILPPLSTTPTPTPLNAESSSPEPTASQEPAPTAERGSRWWNLGRWNMFSNRTVQQASYEPEGEQGEEEISSVVPIVVDHPRNLSCTPEYELRVDDQVGFVFRLNGKPSATPYRLNVGDTIRISSLSEEKLLIDTVVQPDGMIVLPQIGTVAAAGNTIDAVQRELEERYTKYIKEPSIAVVPVNINRTVEELRNAIVNRTGNLVNMNGQIFNSTVAPDGEIQLPAIGSVPAAGLTTNELRTEIELRYAEIGSGIEVTPVLQKRAARNIYVMGEVQKPGRYDLAGPTTVMQAIAMAGGWNKGGNVSEVVVFRRDDNYRLMATRVNVYPGLYNAPELGPCDVWLRDTDLVIVPKLKIQVWDDWIEMVFTRGIYGVVPFNGITFSFFKDLSTLGALN
jgi:polysaccharide export outer membrane protein